MPLPLAPRDNRSNMAFTDKDDAASKGAVNSIRDPGDESDSSSSHIFSDPSVADWWRKRYEAAGYENKHRFDPTYTWTPEEEKKLVRKVRPDNFLRSFHFREF